MGFSQNTVTISGNLTRDPEVRNFPDGGAIVRFGVAWNQRVKDRNTDQWSDVAHFFDVEMRGGVATSVAEQVRKGDAVSFTGRLMQQRWQDKNTGQNRSHVIVQAFDAFPGRRKDGGGGGGGWGGDFDQPAQGGAYAGAPAGGGQYNGPPQGAPQGQQQPPTAPGWGTGQQQPPAQQQPATTGTQPYGEQAGGWGPPTGPPQGQQQAPPTTPLPADDDIPF